VSVFVQLPISLTHYTRSTPQILDTKSLKSSAQLAKNSVQVHTFILEEEKEEFANQDNVFFRYEIMHNIRQISRFGDDRVSLQLNPKQIKETIPFSWVSVDIYNPISASIMKETSLFGIKAREWEKNDNDSAGENQIYFFYPQTKMSMIYPVSTLVFCGEAIPYGIALAVIRELRNMGEVIHKRALSNLNPKPINNLLSKVFRIEAKVPGLMQLDQYSNLSIMTVSDVSGKIFENSVKEKEKIVAYAKEAAIKRQQNFEVASTIAISSAIAEDKMNLLQECEFDFLKPERVDTIFRGEFCKQTLKEACMASLHELKSLNLATRRGNLLLQMISTLSSEKNIKLKTIESIEKKLSTYFIHEDPSFEDPWYRSLPEQLAKIKTELTELSMLEKETPRLNHTLDLCQELLEAFQSKKNTNHY